MKCIVCRAPFQSDSNAYYVLHGSAIRWGLCKGKCERAMERAIDSLADAFSVARETTKPWWEKAPKMAGAGSACEYQPEKK